MKNSIRMLVAGMATLVFFTQAGIVSAAEIKVLCAAGFRVVMEDLGPKFEKASGHKLVLSFGNLGVATKRLKEGETADLVILPKEGIDALVKEGKASASNVTSLAQSGISVAVRKGVARPDISSPEALKRALLSAKSLAYLDPAQGGASGIYIAKMLDKMGIAKEVKSKSILAADTKEIQALIAAGKADLVMHQLGNLATVSGVDIIGPLPGNLQQAVAFTAVVMTGAKDAGAAKALVTFLRNSESAKVMKAKGMDPA